ncbi:MAG: aldo/keto reductase [Burkholderiaceae bacterium]
MPLDALPPIGLGTWRMGESRAQRAKEVTAVHKAIELGYRLIDTAEMYGDGGAEEVTGSAIKAAIDDGVVKREQLIVVSKVLPHNASRAGVAKACDRSRKRLQLDSLDGYLLHWRGSHPLRETTDAFEELKARGAIRWWGVSNFDVDDLEELVRLPHGSACMTNQVYYSASVRGVEYALLPWQREHGMSTMAYSPIDQGAIADDQTLATIGRRHGVSAAQIALAWVIRQPGISAIPKAVREEHLRHNLAAASIRLSVEDLAAIDARYPPAKRKQPLAMT